MSELPGNVPPAEVPRARESALGMVVRRGPSGRPEVLFGRRARTSRFLPGNLAFPGGRLDPADRPGEPGAHRRCASRELREETGLTVDPDAWVAAGERITPPLFPVRFRTEFFVAPAPGERLPESPPSPENDWLGFLSPEEVVERWRTGGAALAPPVLAILRALLDGASGTADRPAAIADVVRVTNEGEEYAPRIEFVPDVWVVPVKTWTLPPATHTNVWLPGGTRFVVVDPGSDDPDELDRLGRVLRRRAEAGARAEAVVLTHHHQDHVPGAASVARALGVPVAAHREVLDRVGGTLGDVPTREIVPDEVVDLGGVTLRAVLTEGHAPGHLAFLVPERRALISGDLVSALSTMLIDPETGDMDAYLASLERAGALGARVLLPSHGPPVPNQALARVRDHRLERERALLEALGPEPSSLSDLARQAYADTPDAVAFLAERQTLAHLIRLRRTGRARQVESGWSAA